MISHHSLYKCIFTQYTWDSLLPHILVKIHCYDCFSSCTSTSPLPFSLLWWEKGKETILFPNLSVSTLSSWDCHSLNLELGCRLPSNSDHPPFSPFMALRLLVDDYICLTNWELRIVNKHMGHYTQHLPVLSPLLLKESQILTGIHIMSFNFTHFCDKCHIRYQLL